jgi:hypothetical protein
MTSRKDRMKVTDSGIPVESLVDAVKAAVKEAGISTVDTDRALRVTSIQLTLNTVATTLRCSRSSGQWIY